MAITRVSFTLGVSGSTASRVQSIPTTVSGNTLIVALASVNSTQQFATSITDNLGGTYIHLSADSPHFINEWSTELWYRTNIPSGLTTVTATYPANQSLLYVAVSEYSGIDTTTPVESVGSLSVNGTTTATGPTLTSSVYSTALYYTTLISSGTPRHTGVSSPWIYEASSGDIIGHAYLIASSLGSYTATFTPASFQNYGSSGAVFIPANTTYTINLSDSVGATDSTSEDRTVGFLGLESLNLSEAFNKIFVTILNLIEPLGMVEAFSILSITLRYVTESILLNEVFTAYLSERILSDQIQVQEWLNIQKNPPMNIWTD